MSNIRTKIVRYMIVITLIIFALTLGVATIVFRLSSKKEARKDAQSMFVQVERVLDYNNEELLYTEAAYRNTCISNAHSISYMLQYNPEIMDDVDGLKEIAKMSEVDEIHIFDTSGTIIKGTNPEYYGYSVYSGEQIGFFKDMLTDKSLELVQDITPNTAEAKPMQYSAVWSKDGKFILQIGMNPVNILRLTEKNSLSNVFAMLNTGVGVEMYAINHDDGTIMGSTDRNVTGKNISEIGPDIDDIRTDSKGFETVISGEKCFCIFKRIDNVRIGYAVSEQRLYTNLAQNLLVLGVSLIVI